MEMTPLELVKWRTDRGLSSEALAALLGVSRKTVSSWENRKHPIPPYMRLALIGIESTGLARISRP